MRMVFALVLAFAAIASVSSGREPDPATEVVVTVGLRGFDPSTVEIRRGTLLTFHSLAARPGGLVVVSDDGSFESWPLGMNSQWSHRFKKVGSFEYFVKDDPGVRGTAIVE